MNNIPFWLYLLTMAGVTYLIRMLPLVLIKKKIKNRYLLSFLYYIPYAVLAVMTIPAIFSSTAYLASAIVGFVAAVITAFFKIDLLTVALVACFAVLTIEVAIKYII